MDVTERAKQHRTKVRRRGVSPAFACGLAPLGTSISRNFSRWNRTAVYVNGWAQRLAWTYRLIADIGSPDHLTPTKGTHPMTLRTGSTYYEQHEFVPLTDNKSSCAICGRLRAATAKDETNVERKIHDLNDKPKSWPSLDMERAKPLRDWLNERNARCAWQVPATKQNPRAIEGWIVNGCVVVIICAEYGWEIYTQPTTNNIEATLIDAERRIGLDPPPTLAKQSPSLDGISKVTP